MSFTIWAQEPMSHSISELKALVLLCESGLNLLSPQSEKSFAVRLSKAAYHAFKPLFPHFGRLGI